MQLQRTFRFFVGELADHTAVIGHRRRQAGNAAGRQEGRGAAHAESDHAQRPDALHVVFGGGDVVHHVVEVQIAQITAGIGDLVRRIAALEIAHETVEHSRRHRHVAERRQPVADRADVMIDAENLLHHDQPAFRRAGRIGAVGAERMLIGGGEFELLTQENLPLRSMMIGETERMIPNSSNRPAVLLARRPVLRTRTGGATSPPCAAPDAGSVSAPASSIAPRHRVHFRTGTRFRESSRIV